LAASLKFLVPFSMLTALGSQIAWSAPERTIAPYFSAVQVIAAPAAVSEAPAQMVTYTSAPAGGPSNWLLVIWAVGAAALAVRWFVRWNAARAVVSAASPAQAAPAQVAPARASAVAATAVSAAAPAAASATAIAATAPSAAASVTAVPAALAPAQIDAPFPIRITATRIEPGVFGIFRPTLLLPANIFESLQPQQLQALIAHEAAHVVRRDNLTAAFHSTVEILFWFHPLVWWIGSRLVAERERACDEAVIRAGKDRNAYAHTLLSVCRLYLGAPVVSASGANGGHLQTRIEAIMNAPMVTQLGAARRTLLAAAAVLAVAAPVAFGIADPARAQAAASTDSADTSTLKFSSVQVLRGDDAGNALVSVEPSRFIARNVTVRELLRYAYGHRLPAQISGGPAWLDTEHYTVYGNFDHPEPADGVVTPSGMPERVRSLLADRFQLRTRVTKGPVYILESAPDAPPSSQKPVVKGIGVINQKNGIVTFRGASSASVIDALSTFLSSQVLDHTKAGVTYSFKMKWPRNDVQALGIQLHDQAGLVLKSFTMEQLVIDSAAQPILDTEIPSAQQIAAR
jgi:uncharacterized protein (TIGR03435 family)